jgi:hypothetical protein
MLPFTFLDLMDLLCFRNGSRLKKLVGSERQGEVASPQEYANWNIEQNAKYRTGDRFILSNGLKEHKVDRRDGLMCISQSASLSKGK